jgi:hypothetical protein
MVISHATPCVEASSPVDDRRLRVRLLTTAKAISKTDGRPSSAVNDSRPIAVGSRVQFCMPTRAAHRVVHTLQVSRTSLRK